MVDVMVRFGNHIYSIGCNCALIFLVPAAFAFVCLVYTIVFGKDVESPFILTLALVLPGTVIWFVGYLFRALFTRGRRI